MLGNLQVFLGPEKLNAYGAMLKANPVVLWGARSFLLATIVIHIGASISLALRNAAARPEPYAVLKAQSTSYAARTMLVSGPLLALFILFHLLHFTVGSVGPAGFDPHDIYGNVIRGFRVKEISVVYIAAMILLGTHLYHGLWSALQTIGASHPKYNCLRRALAAGAAIAIAGGNISIPVAVMLGLIK